MSGQVERIICVPFSEYIKAIYIDSVRIRYELEYRLFSIVIIFNSNLIQNKQLIILFKLLTVSSNEQIELEYLLRDQREK